MKKRDPRIDPRKGDVLLIPDGGIVGTYLTITEDGLTFGDFRFHSSEDGKERRQSIGNWRKAVKKAKVLRIV